jgi:hypothetical protein
MQLRPPVYRVAALKVIMPSCKTLHLQALHPEFSPKSDFGPKGVATNGIGAAAGDAAGSMASFYIWLPIITIRLTWLG